MNRATDALDVEVRQRLQTAAATQAGLTSPWPGVEEAI